MQGSKDIHAKGNPAGKVYPEPFLFYLISTPAEGQSQRQPEPPVSLWLAGGFLIFPVTSCFRMWLNLQGLLSHCFPLPCRTGAGEIREAQGQLLEAFHLFVLERSLSSKSEEGLNTSQKDIESVYEILKHKVFSTLKDSVMLAKTNPDLLQQAVEALKEQEKEDQNYMSENPPDQNTQFRPRKWKELWMATVKESVEARMKDTSRTPRTENLSAVGQNLLHMGKTMREDLTVVAKYINKLYPPEFNVFSVYAELYHNYFATQAKKDAESHLEDKDIYLLLSWVHNFYPKSCCIHVAVNTFVLPSLKVTVKNSLSRCLGKEIQRWKEDKEPEKLNGHFQSELLGIFVIQSIYSSQNRAEAISKAVGEELSHRLLKELPAFLRSYRDAFEDFKEKSKKHRYYKPILIANINNSDFPFFQPMYKKFTENKWDSSSEIMNEIIKTTKRWIMIPSSPSHQAIIEKIHARLVKEYIVRLLKRKVSLKTPAQQQTLAQHISKNAADLEAFCTSNGSQATWLNSALPKLAEIIRLQDLGAIKIEVATFAKTYPDIRKKHLEAFLHIKANLSRNELKSILGYLADSTASTQPRAPLFSSINVS
uniref:TNF alpha induced protein 2 n=1 Tax=Catharus ustulatus TaxID=91951 RepID=A0A8C3XZ51_CATUS